MKKSPLQKVKELHGSKEELAKKVADLLEPADGESNDEHLERLKGVANAKLLHLLEVAGAIKELGGSDAVAEKIAELKGQAKDEDFVTKLKSWPMGQLLDTYKSLKRKAG